MYLSIEGWDINACTHNKIRKDWDDGYYIGDEHGVLDILLGKIIIAKGLKYVGFEFNVVLDHFIEFFMRKWIKTHLIVELSLSF